MKRYSHTFSLLSFLLFLGSFQFTWANSGANLFGYEMVEAEFAYSDNIPKEAIHPLRVLNMVTGCDEWLSINNDGIGPNGIGDPLLEAAVCELMDIIPSAYRDSFMIFDYGMYPSLTYLDRVNAHDVAFDCMIHKVETDFDPPYYLLMGKQINPENGSVEFRTMLRLPRHNEFADMNATLEDGFSNAVLGEIESFHELSLSLLMLTDAESEGIDKLKALLTTMFDGGFSGGLTEAILDLNEFEEIPIDPAFPINFTNTTSTSFLTNEIKDYARIKMNDPVSGNDVFISDNVSQALIEFYSLTAFAGAMILTDNDNYAIGTANDFEAGYNEYENLNTDLLIWLHYFESTDPNTPDKLFAKFKVNLSKEEAGLVVDQLYQEHVYGPGSGTALNQDDESKMFTDCPENPPCGITLKWRAKCCLLPLIEDGVEDIISQQDISDLGDFGQDVIEQSMKYYGGFNCGIIDGVIGILTFVAESANFLVDPLKNTPGNIIWLGDLCIKAWKTGNLISAGIIKHYESVGYWRETIPKIKTFINVLMDLNIDKVKMIFSSIWQSVKQWVDNVIGQNGSALAGYELGTVVFEIVLYYFTAGTGAMANLNKKLLGKFIDAIDDSVLNFGKVLDDAFSSDKVSALKKMACKIGLGGCFVKGTPILMAENQFKNVINGIALTTLPLVTPIQTVQVDDMVKAYNHNEILFTASNLDNIYVPKWRNYDYLDITPETWQVGKFVIEEDNGTIIEIEANRPKQWFENHKLTEKGDIAHITIEEMGISDYVVLQSIRSTKIDTRGFKLNQIGKVDRPVITTYKRLTNNITDYTFSNGQTISCTPNHPFYSSVRKDYIPINNLKNGESILTAGEREVKFIGGKQRKKGENVYNFEVWRAHNYFVGSKGGESFILVHNACWKTVDKVKAMSKKARKKFLNKIWDKGIDWSPGNKSGYFGRGSFMESLLRDTKYKGKVATGKNRNGGSDPLHIGDDQYPAIDFVDDDKVISVKTTKNNNPYSWVESGTTDKYIQKNIKKLLEGLRDGEIGNNVSGINKADLDIYIKEFADGFPEVEWKKAVNKYIDTLGDDLKAVRSKLNVNVSKITDSVNP